MRSFGGNIALWSDCFPWNEIFNGERKYDIFAGLLTTLVFSVLDTLALLFVAQGMRNLMMRFVRMCHLTIIDG